MNQQVVIIGGGIIGAMIAYELSQVSSLKITLLDAKQPASGSTGAALGILMGLISKKTKGRGWRMREASLKRYETLIPELESLTGLNIPYNRQGILLLRSQEDDLTTWERLQELRAKQGWDLAIWSKKQLAAQCPQINQDQIIGAVYSPQDRQIEPTALTRALISGAHKKGVNCQFDCFVQRIENHTNHYQLMTIQGAIKANWIIMAAGIGTKALTEELAQPVDIRPVIGQALRLKLPQTLGNADFQPVITSHDIHIAPIGQGEYWVGATVEFPQPGQAVTAQTELLEKVLAEAIGLCPQLAQGEILKTWSGKRPRPEGEPAPVIRELPGYPQILLATGHYRNGILLAPATAQAIHHFLLGTEN